MNICFYMSKTKLYTSHHLRHILCMWPQGAKDPLPQLDLNNSTHVVPGAGLVCRLRCLALLLFGAVSLDLVANLPLCLALGQLLFVQGLFLTEQNNTIEMHH